ncbi:MAG: DUF2459 domain-containing protein [Ancalomicrobiaceae bacterium]|nr:DUF2459 domain-containing protein [Ancalomicrobiaceae bacterium]
MRWAGRVLIGCVLAIALAVAAGQRWGDPSLAPRPGEATVTLTVIDYGYHAGLFVDRAMVEAAALDAHAEKLTAVAQRFAAYSTIEFGWGDEAFYRSVPTLWDLPILLGLKAVLGLNEGTVVNVVGYERPVDDRLPPGTSVRVTVSEAGFRRMIPLIEATFAGDHSPVELGPGLYGPSLFYRATGRYSALNVCNHWTARLVNAAGRPINLTLATWSRLLVLQL